MLSVHVPSAIFLPHPTRAPQASPLLDAVAPLSPTSAWPPRRRPAASSPRLCSLSSGRAPTRPSLATKVRGHGPRWRRRVDEPAVHAWYLARGLDVSPVNPGSPHVTVGGRDHATVPSLSALPRPRHTSVSIVTPPAVTLGVLREARELGVPAVWMQPGSFDEAVVDFALADGAFAAVVYGDGGRGSEGWCVLVDGDKALGDVGKL